MKIYFQLITYFLKDLHLCRIWDFCHEKSFYTLRNCYCGGMALLKINRWTLPRYFLFLDIKYFVMLSSQKGLGYHFFPSKVYIYGNANAGRACCREHEPPYFTLKPNINTHIVLQFVTVIVIFTAYMHRGGKRGEIWLNIIINLTGQLNLLRHLPCHVFHMCKC